jgi:hypothetical protein
MNRRPPVIVERNRAQNLKGVLQLLLLTPGFVFAVWYYYPGLFVIPHWGIAVTLVVWLAWVAVEGYGALFGDDLLLLINDQGLWATHSPGNHVLPWDRIVEIVAEHPRAPFNDPNHRAFRVVYRPENPAQQPLASFYIYSSTLRMDYKLLRDALETHVGKRLKM